ncbi:MAG: hypothetical protein ACO3GR_05110 [Candidatus Kapaibacteriota bacterium]
MSEDKKHGGHNDYKETSTHYMVFLGLFVAIAFSVYTFVVPAAVKNAVIFLFKPDGVTHTISFTEFQGHANKEHVKHEALVSFDGVISEAGADAAKFAEGQGKPLKGVINNEYIFDLTDASRSEQTDGYTKLSGEWILKAPKLGEAAIVIEPALGFTVLALVFGFAFAILITFVLPPHLGYMAIKVRREIHHAKSKVRLQTGFPDDIVEILTLPDNRLYDLADSDRRKIEIAFKKVWDRTDNNEGSANIRFTSVFDDNTDVVLFRNEMLFLRMKEFFSDFVVQEIHDTVSAQEWEKNQFSIFKALRLYMSHHFTESYANTVTGLAYFGAAILIIIIGIRGLKFIPATRPSLILGAIFLEGAMLALMAFTLLYTQEEERMDRMLKKMEDANRNQLDTLEDVSKDMHKVAVALVEGNSEMIKQKVNQAVSDYLSDEKNIQGELAKEIGDIVLKAIGSGVISQVKKN